MVKKTDFNSKITEIEGKIPSITGLATSSALTAVENKIPDVSNLVNKTDYDTNISDIVKKITDHDHDKYITTLEFNTMAANVFNARLAQANVITKTDFDVKLSGLNKKVTSNKTKHFLVETELKKLEKFDAASFRGKNYFEEDGTQNYLVFQPVYKYFEQTGDKVSSLKSKGLSDGKTISTTTSNDKSATKTIYDNAKIKLKFNSDLLRQNQVTYNHGPVVNVYIVYRSTTDTKTSNIALENCLFGAVKLIKNSDVEKYKYSGYDIGFDSRGSFSHPSGGDSKNVIIFGADLSSSAHANNKVNNVFVLGKSFIQGLNSTTIYAEKMYSTNFTVDNKKICFSLHYNGDNSFLFVNGKKNS